MIAKTARNLSVPLVTGVVAGLLVAGATQADASAPPPPAGTASIVPTPTSQTTAAGALTLTGRSRIVIPAGQRSQITTGPKGNALVGQTLNEVAQEFQTELAQESGLRLPVVSVPDNARPGAGDIVFSLRDVAGLGVEGYNLVTTTTGATITAATTSGAYWGMVTVLQQVKTATGAHRSLPAGSIHDVPSLPMRMYMLDMARKYWQPSYIYDLIRQMSWLKMNVLQMHFVDAEGIRLYSPEFPGLADPANSYSEAQIRSFVAFGKAHNVTIMPGFELPGHATPVSSYFNIGIGDGPDPCGQSSVYGWVTPDFVIDMTNPNSLPDIKKLLSVFVPWFPGPWVHVGADELPPSVASCPRMADYLTAHPEMGGFDGLTNTFLNGVDGIVRGLGKQMAVYTGFSTTASIKVNDDVLATDWTGAGSTLAGHQIVNEAGSAYLTPNNYHNDYPDSASLYSSWTPDNDGGLATEGGAMSVWDDYNYWAQDQYFEQFAALPRAVVADRTWNAAIPADTLTDFTARVSDVGEPPAYQGFGSGRTAPQQAPIHEWDFQPAPRPAGYFQASPPLYVKFFKDSAGTLNGSSYILDSPDFTSTGISLDGSSYSGIGFGGVDLAAPWSYTALVEPSSTGHSVLMSSPSGPQLFFGNGQIGITTASGTFDVPYSVPVNSWSLLAWTATANTVTVYVNGAAVGTITVADAKMPLGALGSTSGVMSGNLSTTAVYDRTLSAKDVAAIWHATAIPPSTSSTP